jgi:hypothetical protein
MLVLVAFLAISAMAVAVLLRFLFAVESDIRSIAARPAEVSVFAHRNVRRTETFGRASALTLVRSNPLLLHRVPHVFMQSRVSSVK